jgi:hypothetical protein
MPFKDSLAEAEREIAKLEVERARIDLRLTKLRKTADSLRSLLGKPQSTDPSIFITDHGITNAIRQVLVGSKIPLSAPEILRGVQDLTRSDLFDQYSNPRAVIFNTLTRLEKQKEVVRVQNPAGQTVGYALTDSSMYKKLFDLDM